MKIHAQQKEEERGGRGKGARRGRLKPCIRECGMGAPPLLSASAPELPHRLARGRLMELLTPKVHGR